ncbi:hypothetical protein CGLO_16870 [Colletotrichum gloeosporioides Cg-14]|uniref:Uncharacterized protein n=1 Tax=Colletotrichum gloeosporioides (strain Cg-14) TaxID=1237896 RepID=T0JY06_COLGC|nr:hypothetical protein CGLO_16870 [Colletotrichum gloeosporioides Cg-14]
MSVQISDARTRWDPEVKIRGYKHGATPPPHLDLGIGNSSSQGRFIATGALRLADQSCAEGSLPSTS